MKPPAGNNGHGVHVINGNAFWNGALTEDTNECCVQQYIRDPLLIRGAKVLVLMYLIFKNIYSTNILFFICSFMKNSFEIVTEDIVFEKEQYFNSYRNYFLSLKIF